MESKAQIDKSTVMVGDFNTIDRTNFYLLSQQLLELDKKLVKMQMIWITLLTPLSELIFSNTSPSIQRTHTFFSKMGDSSYLKACTGYLNKFCPQCGRAFQCHSNLRSLHPKRLLYICYSLSVFLVVVLGSLVRPEKYYTLSNIQIFFEGELFSETVLLTLISSV